MHGIFKQEAMFWTDLHHLNSQPIRYKTKTIWSIGHSSFPVFALETEMYDDAAIGSTTPSLNKKSSVWSSRRFANLSTDEMDGIARLNAPILRVLQSPNQLTFLAIRISERRKSPECRAHQ